MTSSTNTSAAALPDYMTVEQAAAYLQMSVSGIRNYIRQGMMRAFRVAGKRELRIPREAVMGLLEPVGTGKGDAS